MHAAQVFSDTTNHMPLFYGYHQNQSRQILFVLKVLGMAFNHWVRNMSPFLFMSTGACSCLLQEIHSFTQMCHANRCVMQQQQFKAADQSLAIKWSFTDHKLTFSLH